MKNLSKRSEHSMKYRAFHLEDNHVAIPNIQLVSDIFYTVLCTKIRKYEKYYIILISNEDIPMSCFFLDYYKL